MSPTLQASLQEPRQVRELRDLLRDPSHLSALYEAWRSGILQVQRTWDTATLSTPLPYRPDACLLPGDQIQWLEALSAEAKPLTFATWNINSLRTRLPLLLDWLEKRQPDIVALQETKVEDSLFPLFDIQQAGYHAVFSGQKSYNGVAFLSKQIPEASRVGFRNGYDPENCRLISACWEGVWFVNIYLPQGQNAQSDKFQYKLEFLAQLREELTHYESAKLVVLGDLNIAPDERDVPDPEAMAEIVSFRPEERGAFRSLLALGLHDAFRKFETGPQHYTWWDYRTRGFERNDGMRIDHILLGTDLLKRASSCHVDLENRAQVKPSDHAPVFCTLQP